MAKSKKGYSEDDENVNAPEISGFPTGFETKEVVATGSPYHKEGETIKTSVHNADKMVERGWAKELALFLILAMFSFGSIAQTSVESSFKNTTYTTLLSDTVTDAGTASVTSSRIAGGGAGVTVTIQVNVTKISGTVAGTISLMGSLDGSNYKALNTAETQTALATITAGNASAVYHWRLNGNPFLYYRVSWTGAGTMAASFTAKIVKH